MTNFPQKAIDEFLKIKIEKGLIFTEEQFKAMSVRINPQTIGDEEVMKYRIGFILVLLLVLIGLSMVMEDPSEVSSHKSQPTQPSNNKY